MPLNIEVGVEGADRVVRGLRRLEEDAPDIADAQASRVAEFFVKQIKRRVSRVLNWTGKLARTGVRKSQRRVAGRFASGYNVTVSKPMENGRGDVAEWNENARSGHYVSISPDNYPINEWARETGINESVGVIYVTPKPFMSKAVRRGIREMKSFISRGGTVQEFLNKRL